MSSAQLVVVGGGPGGYAAAFLGADLGLSVALVDPEANPGGVCVYRGCIPSKALLHAAKVVDDAESMAEVGLKFGRPEIDTAKLREWKNKVVGRLTGAVPADLDRNVRADYVDHQDWTELCFIADVSEAADG